MILVNDKTNGSSASNSQPCPVSAPLPSAPDPEAPLHVPLGVTGPVRILRLIQGELKADVASAGGKIPTIPIPRGASSKCVLDVLKQLQPNVVWLAYNADWRSNVDAARALNARISTLKSEGFNVALESVQGRRQGTERNESQFEPCFQAGRIHAALVMTVEPAENGAGRI